MRTDWMQNGHEYNGAPEQRAHLRRIIAGLDWQKIPQGGSLSLPMMPALGIQEAVKQYHIPKVSHVAISHGLAPYGFYGVRGHYKGADVEIFLVDEGSAILAVCADITETAEACGLTQPGM